MSQTLLIELGCEELPAGQLQSQAERLLEGLSQQLIDAGLLDATAPRRWLATPRRLAVMIEGVAARQPDRTLQRKGPAEQSAFDAEGQPTPAALGFARSVGLSVEALERVENEQGRWLFATVHQPGRSLEELLPTWLEHAVQSMTGARSMRWSNCSERFLRPVRWLVAMHGAQSLKLSLFGLTAQTHTHGHRVHAPGDIALNQADDYPERLQEAFVWADFEQRKQLIVEQVSALEHAEGLRVNAQTDRKVQGKPYTDPANNDLLNEVCGLVEWPIASLGSFDPAFLEVPAEALISAMRAHQKCFALHDSNGQLAPKFITVANLNSADPSQMISGYERVIRPRLADAQFFYQQDLKQPLSTHAEGLSSAVFHPKLGSIEDKANRIARLATELAASFGADPTTCTQAAVLAKADLMTQMVGEFPELQGTMGRYYATAHGESDEVAVAIESHYRPRFASDSLAEDATGQVVGLADRLDTLVGIFAAGQKPKGSKDPFALRRAALAVVRTLNAANAHLLLSDLIQSAARALSDTIEIRAETVDEVTQFVMDRLSVWVASSFNVDTNTVRAVAAGSACTVAAFVQRCRQLQAFADEHEAISGLIAANKRAANILEKTDEIDFGEVKRQLMLLDEESNLLDAYAAAETSLEQALAAGDFEQVLHTLASLQAPLDAFFDGVMVMDNNEALRRNRLTLLYNVRSLFLRAADIALLGRA
ncbi:MAG: glycine--tRNA ligase subunit beta [Pseudomonadota bacterium]